MGIINPGVFKELVIMPQKKKPNCTACGVLKTTENTSTKVDHNGTVGFMGMCKVCHSESRAAWRRRSYTLDELRNLHAVHLRRAEKIYEEIKQRKSYGQR